MKKLIKNILLITLTLLPIINVNAATGSISLYASSKTVKVGSSTTITIYCKTTVAIGTCEYSLNYDSKKLKLVSGNEDVLDVSTGSSKQLKRSFTFKAIATGSSKVSVKSYAIRDFASENELSTSISPVTITGVANTSSSTTTYSTNNNLKSLSIDGYNITPKFDKNTTKYSIELNSTIESINVNATKEDSTATITGTGNIKLSEGENKIDITVTSQKGTKKVYTIIATVTDSNPIEVTIDNEKFTVIKRQSILTIPENYTLTTTTINDTTIPALFNDITNYTLIGLKNSEGIINLYIYDIENNSFSPYKELIFNKIKLLPLIPNEIINNYHKKNVTIGEAGVIGYKLNDNSKYTLIYGTNLENGTTNWYKYEETENTIQLYDNEINDLYEEKINDLNKLIYIMASIIVFLAVLIIVTCSIKKKKRKPKTS